MPFCATFRLWDTRGYLLEKVGPELRQYIVTSNNEERPFSRDQRRWIYASSKQDNNYFGFGTDNDLENAPNFLIIKQSAFPIDDPKPGDPNFDPKHPIACGKILGESRDRKKKFRPTSAINIAGMSYGSLSGPAVEAINRGCQLAGCYQNTGEGGISKYHLHGGELFLQLGTGYFGCRNQDGSFDLPKLKDLVASNPVRAIEIKISQGAKPGRGGVLPANKITSEISQARGIPMGKDCISPSSHSAFHDVDSMLDFVEQIAQETGVPVGIKSAVGQMDFWQELAERMSGRDRGVDFVAVDGGEGGTGAAPLVFSDHVSLPFKIGFHRVYRTFQQAGLEQDVIFAGSGKLGFPATSLMAFALGCDMIHIGREALLSIGCIQAQRCQSGVCPAGVATQNRWLMRGLDPSLKAHRLANYVVVLRKEIMQLCRACGVSHPSLIRPEHFEIVKPDFQSLELSERFATISPSEIRDPMHISADLDRLTSQRTS